MSHFEILDAAKSNPTIPTKFDADVGSAIPAANILNIFGGTGINTSGAGNTITISADATVATLYTANSGSAAPSGNNLNIYGGYVAAGAAGPLETSGTGSTITANIQLSSAQASSSATNAGVSSFSSTYFSVDANGFVTTSGSGVSETLTGNSGGAVGPSSGNINTLGTGSITIVGSPGTNTTTTQLTGLTNHAILVGAGTATITKVGPSSTTGQVLQSQGSSADPAFSTATYPATTTINQILFSSAANTVAGITAGNYGVLISSSSGVPSWLANGTTGQILTATTSGTPSWENAGSSSVTFTGDTGTPFSGAAVTVTGGTTGLTYAAATPDLTLGGTLKLANGGTNASLTANNGGIFYSTASAGAILSGTATANQVLLSGSSAAPSWSTATYPSTTTINQILYSSSANTIAGITAGNYGVLISSSSGVPSWLANGTTGQVLTATTSGTPSWSNAAASSVTFTGDSGTPFTGNAVTVTGGTTGLTFAAATPDLTLGGTLKLANGGTNANLTASNGGIFYSTASAGAILSGTATANQVLLSGSSAAPAWSTATYPATTTINQLLYSSAANTIGGVTAGNYGVLISSSSGVPSWLANGTTGQILTATTSGTPSWANAPSGGVTWTFVSGTSQAMTGNNYYAATNASLTTLSLPTTVSQGAVLAVAATTAAGWKISQSSGQTIQYGNQVTTSGATGYLSSNNIGDVVYLLCTVANTTFLVTGSVGNINYN